MSINNKATHSVMFQHCASRESDPHLHSHNVVLNLAKHPDGGYVSKYQHAWEKAAGAIYRAEFAKGMID